jgi:hypothetical protein
MSLKDAFDFQISSPTRWDRVVNFFSRSNWRMSPSEWLNRDYERQIWQKQVSSAVLLVLSGGVIPLSIGFGANSDPLGAIFFGLVTITGISMAAQLIRDVQATCKLDRQRAMEAETECIYLRNEHRATSIAYAALAYLGSVEAGGEGESISPSADILPFNKKMH